MEEDREEVTQASLQEYTLEQWASKLRVAIKAVAGEVWSYQHKIKQGGAWAMPSGDDSIKNNAGEQIANAILAYRHLEDATMRLGKVIQANDGGKSIYNK